MKLQVLGASVLSLGPSLCDMCFFSVLATMHATISFTSYVEPARQNEIVCVCVLVVVVVEVQRELHVANPLLLSYIVSGEPRRKRSTLRSSPMGASGMTSQRPLPRQ